MATTKNPLQDADGVNPVFQGVTFTEAPAAPAAQAPAPAQPDAPSATTKPAPTMPTTDEAINRPIIESAYQKAQREYIEGLNRNQPDEAKIREEERVRQQARIDSINQFYNEELNRARKQGEGRLGETRALGAARGVLGSEFGIAEKQGTIDQNNAQERAINAERQVKIDEVFRSIDDAVYKKVEAERTRADKNSKEYLDFLKGTQDEARESVKTLATSGLKSLADLGEERLKKLLEGTGYSQIEAESIFNANKKKEEKVKYTYQELKDGSLLRTGDDGSFTMIKEAAPIKDGFELKELGDGTLVQYNKSTGEIELYGERGEFAKKDNPLDTAKKELEIQKLLKDINKSEDPLEIEKKTLEIEKLRNEVKNSGTGKAPTEAQSKAASFAARVEQAEETIDKLGSQFTGTFSRFPTFDRFKSEDRLLFEQSERNFINAVLRRESGAVISDEEFDNARKQYLPQPGDTQAVLDQKKQSRAIVKQGLQQEAGKFSLDKPKDDLDAALDAAGFNKDLSKSKNGLDALKASIVTQESGGRYNAVGEMTKYGNALGKYQIIPQFHFAKIGLKNTPEDRKRFLETPALQDALFGKIINELAERYDNNPLKIAAAYYGGDGAASIVGTKAADRKQMAGGKEFPSINEYARSVVSRT